jgi:hypothetical protein
MSVDEWMADLRVGAVCCGEYLPSLPPSLPLPLWHIGIRVGYRVQTAMDTG